METRQKRNINTIIIFVVLFVVMAIFVGCSKPAESPNQEGSSSSSNTPSYVKILAEPNNFYLEDGALAWSFANGPEYYANDSKVIISYGETTKEYGLNENRFDITSFIKESGTYTFKVQAKSASLNKETEIVDKVIDINVLSKAFNLVYDNKTQILEWDKVVGASGYLLKINDSEVVVTENKYTIPTSEGLQKIEITTLGNGAEIFNSYEKAEYSINFLKAPTGVRIENGYFLWDPVEGAAKYRVYIDEQMVATRIGENFKLNNLQEGQKIQVIACGNNVDSFDSPLSEAVIYQIVIPDTNTEIENQAK